MASPKGMLTAMPTQLRPSYLLPKEVETKLPVTEEDVGRKYVKDQREKSRKRQLMHKELKSTASMSSVRISTLYDLLHDMLTKDDPTKVALRQCALGSSATRAWMNREHKERCVAILDRLEVVSVPSILSRPEDVMWILTEIREQATQELAVERVHASPVGMLTTMPTQLRPSYLPPRKVATKKELAQTDAGENLAD
jgi:hypothetical protein